MSVSLNLILALTFLATPGLSRKSSDNARGGDWPLFNSGLFQGDIAGVDPDDITDRASIVSPRLLWPNAIVYYELTQYTEYIRDEIKEALQEYHNKTCLLFVEKKSWDNTIKDFIRVQWGTGCWSAVGRTGGMQLMSLGDGCAHTGLIVHEFGHAIGLYHEHSRSDRDDFVEIIWKNILRGQENQFQKLWFWENNLLGEEFDYKSIMLYDEKSFSKDGESITMKVKTPGVVIGPVWKKPGLSAADVRRINRLYQCFGQVRPEPKIAPDFECDFEDHDCQFGQRTSEQGFTREVRYLGGRSSTVLVADAKYVDKIYVNIQTPMYPMLNRDAGCFSFEYYLDGKDIYEISVLKTGKESTHIFSNKTASSIWRKASFDISPVDEEARFFISVYFMNRGPLAKGVLALDNVSFKYRKC